MAITIQIHKQKWKYIIAGLLFSVFVCWCGCNHVVSFINLLKDILDLKVWVSLAEKFELTLGIKDCVSGIYVWAYNHFCCTFIWGKFKSIYKCVFKIRNNIFVHYFHSILQKFVCPYFPIRFLFNLRKNGQNKKSDWKCFLSKSYLILYDFVIFIFIVMPFKYTQLLVGLPGILGSVSVCRGAYKKGGCDYINITWI